MSVLSHALIERTLACVLPWMVGVAIVLTHHESPTCHTNGDLNVVWVNWGFMVGLAALSFHAVDAYLHLQNPRYGRGRFVWKLRLWSRRSGRRRSTDLIGLLGLIGGGVLAGVMGYYLSLAELHGFWITLYALSGLFFGWSVLLLGHTRRMFHYRKHAFGKPEYPPYKYFYQKSSTQLGVIIVSLACVLIANLLTWFSVVGRAERKSVWCLETKTSPEQTEQVCEQFRDVLQHKAEQKNGLNPPQTILRLDTTLHLRPLIQVLDDQQLALALWDKLVRGLKLKPNDARIFTDNTRTVHIESNLCLEDLREDIIEHDLYESPWRLPSNATVMIDQEPTGGNEHFNLLRVKRTLRWMSFLHKQMPGVMRQASSNNRKLSCSVPNPETHIDDALHHTIQCKGAGLKGELEAFTAWVGSQLPHEEESNVALAYPAFQKSCSNCPRLRPVESPRATVSDIAEDGIHVSDRLVLPTNLVPFYTVNSSLVDAWFNGQMSKANQRLEQLWPMSRPTIPIYKINTINLDNASIQMTRLASLRLADEPIVSHERAKRQTQPPSPPLRDLIAVPNTGSEQGITLLPLGKDASKGLKFFTEGKNHRLISTNYSYKTIEVFRNVYSRRPQRPCEKLDLSGKKMIPNRHSLAYRFLLPRLNFDPDLARVLWKKSQPHVLFDAYHINTERCVQGIPLKALIDACQTTQRPKQFHTEPEILTGWQTLQRMGCKPKLSKYPTWVPDLAAKVLIIEFPAPEGKADCKVLASQKGLFHKTLWESKQGNCRGYLWLEHGREQLIGGKKL